MSRYDLLRYERKDHAEPRNWLGNLRWFAEENKQPLSYTFCAIPSLMEEGQYRGNDYDMKRILCSIQLNTPYEYTKVTYGADYNLSETQGDAFKLSFPYYKHASVVQCTLSEGSSLLLRTSENSGRVTKEKEYVNVYELERGFVFDDNGYYVVVLTDGQTASADGGITIKGRNVKVAVAFHKDRKAAMDEAMEAFEETEKALSESRAFWEEYLDSCPVVTPEKNIEYYSEYGKRSEVYTPDELLVRQLWHWWVMPVNVNKLEFNKLPIYMAPDKINWKGTWSNDGPESLCALSLTSLAGMAKECLAQYVAHSISAGGAHSWYMHADGTGCYHNPGDSGYYSHGVPNIVHAVDFYIRNTGDATILELDGGHGMTVWEKLKRYMESVFSDRDINGDGLIEWVNLWETGWDDKISPFFKEKPIDEWIKAMTTLDADGIAEFYAENSHPVTPIVEQVYMLWALKGMENMAKLKKDEALATECREKYSRMLNTVRAKLWDEETGFYYDMDVKNGCLSKFKNADAFYFLFFESDPLRARRVIEHMDNTNEFNLLYIPMGSMDSEGFRADGYWNGGHWPREMSYITLALNKCGYKEKAIEISARALGCTEGNQLAENLNPLSGEYNTSATKLAYCVMNNLALLECFGLLKWSE